MANQILLSVDKQRVSVAPGASVNLAVIAQNLTALVDQVAVRAEGIDPGWTQVIPPYLPVFAQGEATARIVFQPPRDPSISVAGIYPLKVCGASQEFPGQESDAASTLEVQLVGDYRFWLEKNELRGNQEAVFAVKVENSANAPLRLQFKGDDPAQALWFKFDPFQLDVPPGGTGSATLALRTRAVAPNERTLSFTLTAQGELMPKNGAPVVAPTHQVSGQFTQGSPARLTISIQPPLAQGVDRAEYRIQVGNPGAAPVTVELSGDDEAHALDYIFEPSQVTLQPQSEFGIRVMVRALAALTSGGQQRRDWRVTAQPLDAQVPAASAQATFVQLGTPAPAPSGFPWWIVAVAALFGFLIGLFLLAVFELGLLR